MRVVIAEDESDHRQYLSEVISGWGHEVVQAADGQEARCV